MPAKKNKNYSKYSFLLENSQGQNYSVAMIYDGGDSSFPGFRRLPTARLKKTLSKFEVEQWIKLNRYNQRYNIIQGKDVEPTEQDAIIIQIHGIESSYKTLQTYISKFKKRILFLNHFYISARSRSQIAQDLGINLIVSECDLYKRSELFRSIYPWYKKPVLALPYAFGDRFKSLRPPSERFPACVATGTLDFIKDPEYFRDLHDLTESRVLHPMRQTIYENKTDLKGLIDSYISPYRAGIEGRGMLVLLRQTFQDPQPEYNAINIVDLYNNYQMAVVPEEITGLPGIGMVEAMAWMRLPR